jgi:hypothetical protein
MSKWKQRKAKGPVEFWMVEAEHRPKWRKAIYSCLTVLKPKHREVVPPIVVYPALTESIRDTFDPANQRDTDEWIYSLLRNRSWAHSRLRGRHPSYARICLVAHAPYYEREKTPPEMSVFHEMAHFILEEVDGVPYDGSDAMEFDVDRIALEYLVRMIHVDPFSTSISFAPPHVRFMTWVAECVAEFKEKMPPATEEKVDEMCSVMAKAIMENTKWKMIYKNLP